MIVEQPKPVLDKGSVYTCSSFYPYHYWVETILGRSARESGTEMGRSTCGTINYSCLFRPIQNDMERRNFPPSGNATKRPASYQVNRWNEKVFPCVRSKIRLFHHR